MAGYIENASALEVRRPLRRAHTKKKGGGGVWTSRLVIVLDLKKSYGMGGIGMSDRV